MCFICIDNIKDLLSSIESFLKFIFYKSIYFFTKYAIALKMYSIYQNEGSIILECIIKYLFIYLNFFITLSTR